MASSDTEIANMALAHLSCGKRIANLANEQSQEAALCRIFYETAKDATLRDYEWPFSTQIADLALVEEDPNDQWDFSYRYPSDCLKLRKIPSGIRNDSRDTRVPYRIAQDSQGKLIFTDQEDAQIEYTIRVDDPILYPPDFVLALSLRLASYIAPGVTGGDPFKLGERAMRLYALEISIAKSSAGNEEQPEQEPDSEFIRARE